MCRLGFTGPDCSVRDCPSACHNNGVCVNGVCDCDKGYRGIACQERFVFNGKLVEGFPVCDKGWTGSVCDEKVCLENCNNNGHC